MAMSILEVTAMTLGVVSRLMIRLTSPTRRLRPKAKAVASRMTSRTGLPFQARTARGTRKAVRCPASTTNRPKWNGTLPQKSLRPSRNCDDSDETLKPVCR